MEDFEAAGGAPVKGRAAAWIAASCAAVGVFAPAAAAAGWGGDGAMAVIAGEAAACTLAALAVAVMSYRGAS